MPDWLAPAGSLLPLHWLRPSALLRGLLAALVLLAWGRRPGGSAVPRGVIDEALLPHLLVQGGRAGWLRPGDTLAAAVACSASRWPARRGSARRRRWRWSRRR